MTGGTRRGIKAAACGCWGSGIDADRVLHSNDRRVGILKEPTDTGRGASSVALKRRKRNMGKGSIFTAYTVRG
jgi:hypothetical protein